jgi:N-methylhydantoinase A/oxoprolinase/acetone carboxylase beta subunit
MSLRLGIDVGGTNTDAVLVRDGAIIATVKRPTSDDVAGGIAAALDAVLEGVDPREVALASLGTTQCTNAIVERRGLRRVGAVRLGAPATTAVPPLEEWPDDLREAVLHDAAVLPGGHHVDGREISHLDEVAVRSLVRSWSGEVEAVAVTSVFSPVSDEHERRVAAWVADELDVPISVSHEIGSIGLLERENATVINAALTGVAQRAAAAFEDVLRAAGVTAMPYLSQNDGTLMDLQRARRYPVLTIASGPTNSLRGAAWLSGRDDAIVVDVGGTTADLGALTSGFPRESANAIDVGGVRTNFRMPDLVAVALGGGTIVRDDGEGVRLGPDSVGHRITTEGLVFGGATTTLTDVAVAAGEVALGDPSRADVDPDLVVRARERARQRLGDALDRVRTTRDDVLVVAVGGGAFLVPDDLPGASEVVKPDHHEVANAVGAAMAEVSGTIDRVVRTEDGGRERAVREAIDDARAQAIEGGADPQRLREIEVEEIALSYLPGGAVRVRVRSAGPITQLGGRPVEESA